MLKLGKKINFRLIFWIIFFFFVFGLLLRNSFRYLDADLGWHLKVGQEIALTGDVPHVNNFNYTFVDRWVDHEWLINLISFKIYDNFGHLSLNIFFALVIVVAFIIILLTGKKRYPDIPDWLWASLILFGLVASSPHFGIRMQEFGFLFLSIELWIIWRFKQKQNWLILLLPVLFYLWANIHASFLIGLGVLFSWFGYQIIIGYRNYKRILIFIGIFLGSIVATLLTPYRMELYSFLVGYRNSFYMKVIREWLSQLNFPFVYWQLAFLAVLILFLVLFLVKNFRKAKELPLWEMALIVFFCFLSFRSRRHFPLLVVISLPFLAQSMTSLLELEKTKLLFRQNYLRYLIWLILVLAVSLPFLNLEITKDPFARFCVKYPCDAVNFLEANPQYDNLNMLNEYNWGGYLIWQTPTRKLYIDGRLPQAQFAGKTLIEEYLSFYGEDTDLRSKLAQYDIRLVLMKTQDDRVKIKRWEEIVFWLDNDKAPTPNYLRQYLENSPEWERAYLDEIASIYIKKE